MAHAAEIDATGTVLRVVVVHNDEEPNVEQFCTDLFGGVWKQTSYNNSIRVRFAGIGYIYDETLDAFIPPRCHDEAVLNSKTADWNCANPSHSIKLEN